MLKYFAGTKSKAYARGGAISKDTVILKAGEQALAKYPGTMEPQFRSLGNSIE